MGLSHSQRQHQGQRPRRWNRAGEEEKGDTAVTFSSNLYRITAWATSPEILGDEDEDRDRERWQTP